MPTWRQNRAGDGRLRSASTRLTPAISRNDDRISRPRVEPERIAIEVPLRQADMAQVEAEVIGDHGQDRDAAKRVERRRRVPAVTHRRRARRTRRVLPRRRSRLRLTSARRRCAIARAPRRRHPVFQARPAPGPLRAVSTAVATSVALTSTAGAAPRELAVDAHVAAAVLDATLDAPVARRAIHRNRSQRDNSRIAGHTRAVPSHCRGAVAPIWAPTEMRRVEHHGSAQGHRVAGRHRTSHRRRRHGERHACPPSASRRATRNRRVNRHH